MSAGVGRRAAMNVRCTALSFAVLGVGLAGWAPRVPDVKSRLSLSDAELGGALLAVAAGSMLFMPVVGVLIGRFGTHLMLGASGVGFSLALALPGLAPNLLLLVLGLAVLGAAIGALDVSANAHAAAIEEESGKQIMGTCHGLYSVGAIIGAISGGVTAQFGATVTSHLLVLGAGLALVCMVLYRGTAPAGAIAARLPDEQPGPGALVLPSPALLGLGALAFCALMAEGAMVDWSAVYLREYVSASPFIAGAGFAVFSAGMAAGRLICDRVVERRGRLFVIRTGAVIAGLSVAFSLVQDNPLVALAGFAGFGFGLSAVLPVLFSIAGTGKTGMAPGHAIAALATAAYTGLLLGPALIGLFAGLVGLPSSLLVLPCPMFMIALGAGLSPVVRMHRTRS